MDTRRQTTPVLEPPTVPADRLYRVAPEVYRGMVDHGLIAPHEVALADGLLVQRAEGANGPADPLDRLYRMPLDIYDRAAEIGLLGPCDRTELLDGLLVTKMSREPPHVLAACLTWEALARAVPAGWYVKKEDPVGLPSGPSGHDSEPEPDVSVVRGTARDYAARHPGPGDTALIVEVSESSLREDRSKLARYAWENIPVAWVVNLNDRVVEVYTRPSGPVAPAGYRDVTPCGPDDDVPVVIDGHEVGRVAARGLLP
jgi:hypothetical protein